MDGKFSIEDVDAQQDGDEEQREEGSTGQNESLRHLDLCCETSVPEGAQGEKRANPAAWRGRGSLRIGAIRVILPVQPRIHARPNHAR